MWNKYFRLQVALGQPPVQLDDASPAAIQTLETITGLFIQKHQEKIRDIVAELSLPRSSQCGSVTGNDYEPVIGPRIRRAPVRSY